MIGTHRLSLQHFDSPLLPLAVLAMLNDAAMMAVVAIEERGDDGGSGFDHQLLDLQETLAWEPTLVLGLWVLWARMLVVVVLA